MLDLNQCYSQLVEGQHLQSRTAATFQLPGASNLKLLMTSPKNIVAKNVATLGSINVKYPYSIFENKLERQRQELRSTSIHSPKGRLSRTRNGS